MKNKKENIAVIGGGSWGTALANQLAENGHNVKIWCYEPELVDEINRLHTNSIFLSGIELNRSLAASSVIIETISSASIILLVAPLQVTDSIIAKIADKVSEDQIIASASKGIDTKTLQTVSQMMNSHFSNKIRDNYVALSGPTFAREVALKLPTLIVAASKNEKAAKKIQAAFSSKTFRVYTNSDVIGVELGGGVKNVIAIAAGICDGLGFGSNARAALITRGLAEITRLGVALGAEAATFAGLAGMGDLVLTCTGELSRNRSVGLKLGAGMKLQDILSEMKMVAEGVKSAEGVYLLSQKLGVEMPIVEKTYQILYQNKPAKEAVVELMMRDLKAE